MPFLILMICLINIYLISTRFSLLTGLVSRSHFVLNNRLKQLMCLLGITSTRYTNCVNPKIDQTNVPIEGLLDRYCWFFFRISDKIKYQQKLQHQGVLSFLNQPPLYWCENQLLIYLACSHCSPYLRTNCIVCRLTISIVQW